VTNHFPPIETILSIQIYTYAISNLTDTYEERRKKNEGYLTQAIKDLIAASKYFHKDIIDDNGILKFK
jgi:hypothetical protein